MSRIIPAVRRCRGATNCWIALRHADGALRLLIVEPGVARRPAGAAVDCPLLRITRDAARAMCAAAGDGWKPSSVCHGILARQNCSPCDDAHTHPFDFLCPIGRGNFGTVLLVQSRVHPTRFFAAKGVTRLLEPSPFAATEQRDGDEAHWRRCARSSLARGVNLLSPISCAGRFSP
ncbi:putative serine/threonine protein kinase [Trypanosoma cruzi]|uniref:Putative serine/threonine protein kinase n=1 Tax=Trypanosoma cruzi TaxID=5693 RepID=A0A2V2WHK6_TRYCR|nr:putative serine/threonine protein kinase [Trypanosoma cruzi]